MVRQNEARDLLALMEIQDFTYYSVHNEPLISSSQDKTGIIHPKININATSKHAAGICTYLHINHLWQCHTDTIIDTRVSEIDAKTYRFHSLDKFVERQEK